MSRFSAQRVPFRTTNVVTYDQETMRKQAEMLGNRVKKKFRTLRSHFEKQQIGAFRLYDRDIPEVRAVVDWYEGHVVLGEYVRKQTEGTPYLEILGEAVVNALQLPPSHLHLRRRSTRPKQGERYSKLSEESLRLAVREGDHRFWVDLKSYLDIGLFNDHRLTRQRVKAEAQGRDVLNLYCYTGSFTVYAAAGQARSTLSVDLSEKYLEWTRSNLELNGLTGPSHRQQRAEVGHFLAEAYTAGRTWDLIVLDPPSFSFREGLVDFDILRDHRELVRATLRLLRPGGTLYFSSNHQRFQADLDNIHEARVQDISHLTLPLDYEGRTPHRLFSLQK